MNYRLFTCVELPEADRSRLAALQAELRRSGAAVSWAQAQNLHVTLHFLGDVDVSRVNQAGEALAECAARAGRMELALEGTGAFPSLVRPRVLWVGLRGDVPDLVRFHADAAAALLRAGFPLEERRYTPHVTLGRVKPSRDSDTRALARALSAVAISGESFEIGEVTLMRSELDPRGARYTPIARFALSGGAKS